MIIINIFSFLLYNFNEDKAVSRSPEHLNVLDPNLFHMSVIYENSKYCSSLTINDYYDQINTKLSDLNYNYSGPPLSPNLMEQYYAERNKNRSSSILTQRLMILERIFEWLNYSYSEKLVKTLLDKINHIEIKSIHKSYRSYTKEINDILREMNANSILLTCSWNNSEDLGYIFLWDMNSTSVSTSSSSRFVPPESASMSTPAIPFFVSPGANSIFAAHTSITSSTTSSANQDSLPCIKENNKHHIASAFKIIFGDPRLAPSFDLAAQDIELRIRETSRTDTEYLQNMINLQKSINQSINSARLNTAASIMLPQTSSNLEGTIRKKNKDSIATAFKMIFANPFLVPSFDLAAQDCEQRINTTSSTYVEYLLNMGDLLNNLNQSIDNALVRAALNTISSQTSSALPETGSHNERSRMRK